MRRNSSALASRSVLGAPASRIRRRYVMSCSRQASRRRKRRSSRLGPVHFVAQDLVQRALRDGHLPVPAPAVPVAAARRARLPEHAGIDAALAAARREHAERLATVLDLDAGLTAIFTPDEDAGHDEPATAANPGVLASPQSASSRRASGRHHRDASPHPRPRRRPRRRLCPRRQVTLARARVLAGIAAAGRDRADALDLAGLRVHQVIRDLADDLTDACARARDLADDRGPISTSISISRISVTSPSARCSPAPPPSPTTLTAPGGGILGRGRGRGNRTRPRHRPGLAGAGRRYRLAEIPGVSVWLAIVIIAEIGLNMALFPTPAHLVSWMGLCRSAAQSGTRHGKGKPKKGNSYARAAAGQAAIGTAGTATFLGERYARIARRRGGAIAQVAVARSIMIIIWHLLADPAARYSDLGPDWHATHVNRDKKIRNHIRGLQALGLTVTVTDDEHAA